VLGDRSFAVFGPSAQSGDGAGGAAGQVLGDEAVADVRAGLAGGVHEGGVQQQAARAVHGRRGLRRLLTTRREIATRNR
jgi:hypothetical protein